MGHDISTISWRHNEGYFRQHCRNCAFEWSDHSPVEYLNWKPNEPNNANDGEDCVFAYDYPWDYGTFTWNDGHCDRAFRYICQVYKEGTGINDP